MNILIIEDELPAHKRLVNLLREADPEVQIMAVIDSVEEAVKWINSQPSPDLIFMDIQLADGLSFDIFSQTELQLPVIFTTAYDQYSLKAFKVNSVDYLLKPIDPEELKKALKKYERIHQQKAYYDKTAIRQLMQAMSQVEYKQRFIVKAGQQLNHISVEEIQYFFSQGGLVYARIKNGKKHLIDHTLDQLEELIHPGEFFRINRKIITHINAMRKISTYFNSRLKLELNPPAEFDVIVSRDRVGDFKKWLDK